MKVHSPTWSSYIVSAVVAVVVSWALTGCRFRNYSESPANTDPVTGYYEANASSLNFVAQLHGADATHPETRTANRGTNEIPSLVSGVMVNPVALILLSGQTGQARLTNPDTGASIPVAMSGSTFQLSSGSTGADQWDTHCTSEVLVDVGGAYTQFSSAKVIAGHNTIGHVAADFSVTRYIDGDCTATLQYFQDCYNDNTQCVGSDGAYIHQILDPFINSGAITAADIPKLISLTYEASYE